MNTKNSKTNEPNEFRYYFTNKLNLKNRNKTVALANLSIYYTWKNIKSEYTNNNKFKITAPTWDENLDIPDGSYNVQQIQDYFEFNIKKHETITDGNSPIKSYVNNIKNRIVLKIKTGYKLELLTNETTKLLGDGPIIDRDKNSSNVLKLEVVNTVLVHCNIVQNHYQQASKVLYTFVPNKSFNRLINIHPSSLIELKTIDAQLNFIDVWFTDQENRPLEIEDSVNITLIIGIDHFG